MRNERELKPSTTYRDEHGPNAVFRTERRADAFRLMFDLLKHLTTLNSGSILVVLALVEKFVKASVAAQQLFQAVVAFAISIGFALAAMCVLAFLGGGRRPTGGEINFFAVVGALSILAFSWGMIVLCGTVARSLG